MPIYEYKCNDCETVSEILVKSRAKESEVTCPDCNSSNLNKLISVPGAMMTKGSQPDLPPAPPCGNAGQCNMPSCPAMNN